MKLNQNAGRYWNTFWSVCERAACVWGPLASGCVQVFLLSDFNGQRRPGRSFSK